MYVCLSRGFPPQPASVSPMPLTVITTQRWKEREQVWTPTAGMTEEACASAARYEFARQVETDSTV